jgi:hypothetical protein
MCIHIARDGKSQLFVCRFVAERFEFAENMVTRWRGGAGKWNAQGGSESSED